MLLIKAFHIVSMVAWFAGLFYLPRLFVYHAQAIDALSKDRFIIMERRLFYGIMLPASIATTVLGLWLFSYNIPAYMHMGWMHVKLTLVALVWIYHGLCGRYLQAFARDQNRHAAFFYRIFNELPVFLLVGIIIMVVVKPF